VRFVWLLVGWLQVAAGFAIEYFGYRERYVHKEYANATGLMAEGSLSLGVDWLTFLFFTPLGWLSVWLLGEGLLRILSSGMDQPFTTLPLVLFRFVRKHAHPKPPPLPPDILRTDRDGQTLTLESAIDYRWDALATIDVDGVLYSVEMELVKALRPYRYQLTPIAPDHVIRVVTRYPLVAANSAASKP
jgi:hypothetical protein